MKQTYFVCLLLAMLMALTVITALAEDEAPADDSLVAAEPAAADAVGLGPQPAGGFIVDGEDGAEPAVAPEARLMYVLHTTAADRLNLRGGPVLTAEILGRFYTGTVVEAIGAPAEFTQVRVGDLVGYMQTTFLSDTRVQAALGAWGVVSNPNAGEKLNLRASTQEGALSLGLFPNGTTVQILGDEGEHYKVRTHDQEGYMLKAYVLVDGEPGKPVMTELSSGMLEADVVSLYAFPSTDSVSLGLYARGARVRILGVAGVWYYVEMESATGLERERQRGFILSQHVRESNAASGAAGQTYAVIKNANEEDRLTLRASAAWSSESLGIYPNASQMIVLDTVSLEGPKPTWVRVRIGDREGYIQGEFIGWVSTTELTLGQ